MCRGEAFFCSSIVLFACDLIMLSRQTQWAACKEADLSTYLLIMDLMNWRYFPYNLKQLCTTDTIKITNIILKVKAECLSSVSA